MAAHLQKQQLYIFSFEEPLDEKYRQAAKIQIRLKLLVIKRMFEILFLF